MLIRKLDLQLGTCFCELVRPGRVVGNEVSPLEVDASSWSAVC